jgi:hypothetical protein
MSGSASGLANNADIADFIRGLTLLGTGGGGRPEAGFAALQPLVTHGQRVTWRAVEDIADDAHVCALSGVGSIAPVPPLSVEERLALGYPATPHSDQPMVRALRALEEATGRRVSAVFPIELGAGNTPTPIAAAAALGLDVIDGDCCGRAIPEMSQSSVARLGMPMLPAVFADPWGSVIVVREVESPALLERIGKLLSLATKLPDMRAQCARAAFLMTGAEMKRAIVPGGMTRALQLGRAIDAAVQKGFCAGEAAAAALGGWVLFRGTVTSKVWESREGFMFGTTIIAGEGEDAGDTLELWFKNENHIARRNGVPWITSPDLLMLLHPETGEAWTNTQLPGGVRVAVIGAAADAASREDSALRLLGPAHYGHDIAYRAIEQVVA